MGTPSQERMTVVRPQRVDVELIQAASQLIAAREGDENHTVAAAARDVDGGVHRALNLYHFTGGPCAELAVMAAAATATTAALCVIVAVGDRGRGVVPPCGRCRQVLLDYHPGVEVVVPDGAGLAQVPVQELLPWTYSWREHQASTAGG